MTVSTYSKVTLRAHPGNQNDHSVKVEKGGILEFINDNHEFPEFEIEFSNCAPPSPYDTLTGTVNQPIILHMPDELTVFHYYILHKRKNGEPIRGPRRFAHTCGPCD